METAAGRAAMRVATRALAAKDRIEMLLEEEGG